jgi:8-oxo-dGTP pyrophosphatase MutT (NUDIX family)
MSGDADAAMPADGVILKSRVIVVDGDGAVLLFLTKADVSTNPTRWLTPGGHLEGDETHSDGAVRELFEETGLEVTAAQLGLPVWSRDFEAEPAAGILRSYHEEWYLLRVPRFEPVDTHWTDDERVDVEQWRWWSLAGIRGSADPFEPADLAEVLRAVL